MSMIQHQRREPAVRTAGASCLLTFSAQLDASDVEWACLRSEALLFSPRASGGLKAKLDSCPLDDFALTTFRKPERTTNLGFPPPGTTPVLPTLILSKGDVI